MNVSIVDFNNDYNKSVFDALSKLEIDSVISSQSKFIIKPNLVTADKPPTTTDVRCVEAIIDYIISNNNHAKIVIAEGTADSKIDTNSVYKKLGYAALLKKFGNRLKLFDLNTNIVVSIKNDKAKVIKELKVSPEIFNGYFISVPVLKHHSINGATLSIKNLIGILPECFYSGYWNYKKSMVHKLGVDDVLFDLYNYYIKIDLAVIDAAIGQKNCHLSGPPFSPLINKIICSTDALQADISSLPFLNKKLDEVTYLKKIFNC
jgi:uncharacterized protein (DUF362 family)